MRCDPARVHGYIEIDLSQVPLRRGEFVSIWADGKTVEVMLKEDGTLQICVPDMKYVHLFDEIYSNP